MPSTYYMEFNTFLRGWAPYLDDTWSVQDGPSDPIFTIQLIEDFDLLQPMRWPPSCGAYLDELDR